MARQMAYLMKLTRVKNEPSLFLSQLGSTAVGPGFVGMRDVSGEQR